MCIAGLLMQNGQEVVPRGRGSLKAKALCSARGLSDSFYEWWEWPHAWPRRSKNADLQQGDPRLEFGRPVRQSLEMAQALLCKSVRLCIGEQAQRALPGMNARVAVS